MIIHDSWDTFYILLYKIKAKINLNDDRKLKFNKST